MTNATSIINTLVGNRWQAIKDYGKAYAASNIALAKYWGKRDSQLNLPMNSSLSISLGHKGATATIKPAQKPRLWINHEELVIGAAESKALIDYLTLFGNTCYELSLEINLPIAAGLASSACIFAATVLALNDLYQWQLKPQALSILARLGSGSAARSVSSGFVQWHKGEQDDGMDSYASQINTQWPALRIGICLVSQEKKAISSRVGMQRTVETSPLYQAWPQAADNAVQLIKNAIAAQDFSRLGEAAEHNALSLHATMLSAWPPLCYANTQTWNLIHTVWQLREQGIAVYFTQDAGPNIKLLFLEKDQSVVANAFNSLEIIIPFRSPL